VKGLNLSSVQQSLKFDYMTVCARAVVCACSSQSVSTFSRFCMQCVFIHAQDSMMLTCSAANTFYIFHIAAASVAQQQSGILQLDIGYSEVAVLMLVAYP
jgi:hypothetical protein